MFEFISNIPFFSTVWFGIIAMIIVGSSWSLVGLVMGDAPKRGIEPSLVQLFGSGFSCMLSIIIMIVTGSVPHGSLPVIFTTCLVYAACGSMNFFMLQIMAYAMQRGPNGIIWSIIQSALIFPFLGGVIFFDVQLTFVRLLGILALLCALILFGFGKDNSRHGGNWRIPAFICLAICAIQQNLQTAPSYFEEARIVNSIARSLSVSGGTFLSAMIYNIVRMTPERKQQQQDNIRNITLWKYVGALQFFGLIFAYTLMYPGMNTMADHGLGGMCFPMLVGSCIVAFTLASVWLLKEKLRPLQLGALVFCISGLIAICLPC